MSLNQVCEILGWPSREEILYPKGVGAAVFAQLSKEKLGKAISRLPGGSGVEVGVLASDPDATEAPLAIICEFANAVPAQTLLATQKLAWNFCRALLLVTIEPHLIRKWSCFEKPVEYDDLPSQRNSNVLDFDGDRLPDAGTPEILPRIEFDAKTGQCLDSEAAVSLQWIELLSGHFYQKEGVRFPQDQRADRMLLSNLKEVRGLLRERGLDDRYSHDLLARIIFVQFLFDRKDSNNKAALDAEKLRELHADNILSAVYTNLSDVLAHYEDAYSLFQWLNQRFNGDLFPGKGATPELREEEWQEEKNQTTSEHLKLLADFVKGDLEMKRGQGCLWPQYAFDAIPLEFISSIYEEFVSGEEGTGVHYTPGYLVDMMLDRVLPWNSDEWDLSILDPACGSGIFLVKAYQRLIYRWKYAHNNTRAEISPDVLRHILEFNLFGVDEKPNAVRVASFSLYLAMCDEIDPRHYWSDEQQVRFPVLRGKRIIHSDFFEEDVVGFRTDADAGSYDLVIGNPPWGDTTMTEEAKDWAKAHKWTVANKDFGILFVAKSMALTKCAGRVCMIQSASALLYNQADTAVELRHKIFLNFKQVEGVINLAAFRIFKDVRVPTCVIMLRNQDPTGEALWYECPKPLHTSEDFSRITIEAQDVHFFYPSDIEAEPWLWSLFMWGANRDRNLIRRLNNYPNFDKLKDKGEIETREGVNRGSRRLTEQVLVDKPYIDVRGFDKGWTLQRSPSELAINTDPKTHRSVDTDTFQLPQLVIKTSWTKKAGRFRATFIDTQPNYKYVFCSQNFVCVHADDAPLLKAACLCYNSIFANYYLLLTSGRFAFDRSEPLVQELRSIPLPKMKDVDISHVHSKDDVDKAVYSLYEFKAAETILIDDLERYTLPDYKERSNSPGRQPTHRVNRPAGEQEPELQAYCDAFCKVLRSAYGVDKHIGAEIFTEQGNALLPVRMIRFYLHASDVQKVNVKKLDSHLLRRRLSELYETMINTKNLRSFYQRSCRTYESRCYQGQTSVVVNLIKPDQARYWTRSMALRDADAVVADITIWGGSFEQLHQNEAAVIA